MMMTLILMLLPMMMSVTMITEMNKNYAADG